MNGIAKIFIKVYRYTLSPILSAMGGGCRFHPTCSEYSREAFDRYNFLHALWLTIRRLAKCGPWHPGGIDHHHFTQ